MNVFFSRTIECLSRSMTIRYSTRPWKMDGLQIDEEQHDEYVQRRSASVTSTSWRGLEVDGRGAGRSWSERLVERFELVILDVSSPLVTGWKSRMAKIYEGIQQCLFCEQMSGPVQTTSSRSSTTSQTRSSGSSTAPLFSLSWTCSLFKCGLWLLLLLLLFSDD